MSSSHSALHPCLSGCVTGSFPLNTRSSLHCIVTPPVCVGTWHSMKLLLRTLTAPVTLTMRTWTVRNVYVTANTQSIKLYLYHVYGTRITYCCKFITGHVQYARKQWGSFSTTEKLTWQCREYKHVRDGAFLSGSIFSKNNFIRLLLV